MKGKAIWTYLSYEKCESDSDLGVDFINYVFDQCCLVKTLIYRWSMHTLNKCHFNDILCLWLLLMLNYFQQRFVSL